MNSNIPLFDTVNDAPAPKVLKKLASHKQILALLIRNHKERMKTAPASQQYWPYFKGIASFIEFKEICRMNDITVHRDVATQHTLVVFNDLQVAKTFKWKDYPFQ